MTDIFSKEGIQTSSINPTAPVVNAINSQGQPTAKPTGKINYDAVAASLGDMQDSYTPAAQPSRAPPEIAAQAPDVAPVMAPDPAATAPVQLPSAPKDLFAAEGIDPPSLTEQNVGAMNGGVNISNPVTPEQQQVAGYVDHQNEQDLTLARTRFTPEQLEGFKNNPITFTEAGKFLDYTKTLPAGGIFGGIEAWEMTHAAKKLQNGATMKDLSVEEQSVLLKHVDTQLEMNLRGFSFGGKMAYIGSQIPAFVTEFVATAGVGKLAQETALKGAESLAMKGALRAATGGVARTLTQTSLMLPQYTARYGEQRINDSMAITDKGELLVRQSTEAPAVSALKAFGYTAADVAGQIAVPAVGQYVVDPLTKAVKTPLIAAVNALPVAVKNGLYEAYKLIQPTAEVSKVFSAAGWKGMLEQLGANRVSEIIHATTDLSVDENYSWHDYIHALVPSGDQLMVEGGLIAIAGGIHTATSVSVNLLKAKGMPAGQAAETVANMTANEKEQFVEKNLPTPKSDYAEATTADGKPVINPAPEGILAAESSEPSHPEAEIINSQIKAVEKAEPPPVLDEESNFNLVYRSMWNKLDPIQKLPDLARERGAEIPAGEDTKLLSTVYSQNIERIRQNLQVATSVFDKAGNLVTTGKALKPIMDDFDNYFMAKEPSREQRKADFNDYLVARRYIFDLKDNKNVEVSEMKLQESADSMKRLADKYGDDFGMMKTFANEVYGFQSRILDNLVSSGVMSEDLRKKIGELHQNYVPLQKVIDEDFHDAISSKGTFTDARMSKVIKRIKGSDLEDKDVFNSIIKNTAKILDLSARNQVAKSVADLAQYLPEHIEKTNAAIVKKGTAEIKVTYDPKLRTKLEAAIKFFGNDIQRQKSVKVKGSKTGNTLGSYSPMEKLIRMKIGTTEGVLAHEVGHMLDYSLGLKEKMLTDKTVKAELQKLAEDRLNSDIKLMKGEDGIKFHEELHKSTTSKKYMAYIKNDDEILANFFDAYVNTPEALAEQAPTALAAFEKIVDADPQYAFLKEIKPSVNRQQEVVSKDVYGEADYAPPSSITVFREGEKEYYKVSKPILEAMTKLTPSKVNFVEKLLLAPFKISANVLRAGATLTPEFIARNILRDQHDAFLQSGVKYNPTDFAKGLFAALGHSDLYNQWAASGGKYNSYMQLDDAGIEKAYRELFAPKGKMARYLKNPLAVLHDTAQATEQATRIGVFSKAKEQGLSDIEAAVASLDATINFARSGSVGGKINEYIPFFNAGLQASDKLIRTFKENPKALTFWGLATITVPSMMLTGYYLYEADDQTRKEYLEIPQWQKDIAWPVKINGEWKRYPKPFTYGFIFGSIPERMLLWMYDGNKPQGESAFHDIVKGLAGSVSPVNDWSAIIPPLAKMAIEDVSNYNFFTGRTIYPSWMDSLTPEKRANKYTSETAKLAGEKLGLSPALIENTVTGSLGGSGKYLLDAGDKIINGAKEFNGEKVAEKPITASDLPLLKGFAIRRPAGYRSNSAAEFFNNYEQAAQQHAVLNGLDGKEQSEYQKANQKTLAQYGELSAAYKEMKGLQKEADAIYDHKTMKAEDKVKRINHLEDQITNVARSANLKYHKSVGEK